MFGPRGDVITALVATVTMARRQKETCKGLLSKQSLHRKRAKCQECRGKRAPHEPPDLILATSSKKSSG